MRVFVIRRILIEIDSRQSCDAERASVRAEDGFVVDCQIAKPLQIFHKIFCDGNQIGSASKIQANHRALSIVENHRCYVIREFVVMHFRVSK